MASPRPVLPVWRRRPARRAKGSKMRSRSRRRALVRPRRNIGQVDAQLRDLFGQGGQQATLGSLTTQNSERRGLCFVGGEQTVGQQLAIGR